VHPLTEMLQPIDCNLEKNVKPESYLEQGDANKSALNLRLFLSETVHNFSGVLKTCSLL